MSPKPESRGPESAGQPREQYFDRYAGTYGRDLDRVVSFSGQDSGFFTQAKIDLLRDLFVEKLGATDGLQLLDIGCGTGTLHPGLTGMGLKVTGVDVASGPLEVAKVSNPGVRYETFDGRKLLFEEGTFDVALAVCVFHHVPAVDQAGLAAEMRRVTRNGGLVVIIEHNPLNPLTRFTVWRCPFDEDAVLLPARRARALLETLGSSADTRYFLFFPFRHPVFKATERRLEWLGLGAQYCAYATNRNSRAT